MGNRPKDITGIRSGRLVAVKPVGQKHEKGPYFWECDCDCGGKAIVRVDRISKGTTKSCGCLLNERIQSITMHGESKTRLHKVWEAMHERCERPGGTYYKDYGGRGIRVCEEWSQYTAFAEWARANGYDETAPRGQCTIERKDVNGDYCPDNCCWTTQKEQSRNRRSSRFLTHNGETHTVAEWAEITGIRARLIYKRLYAGWPTERALSVSASNRDV